MARTRSKPTKAAPKASTPEPPTSTAKPLPASTSNPPKLFVLPKDASKDARIVTLDNPANTTPSRYFFCPEKGFYEFTRIAAPKKDCRSWLITGELSESQDEETTEEKEDTARIGNGYLNKTADLFIATPIDTLFLILPALAPKSAKDTKQHFLALEDYLDMLSSSSPHWKALLSQYPILKSLVERRMRVLCDTVDAGEETMFRISLEKLSAVLLKKAERMVAKGLPPSMEDKLVKTALEIPVMSIKREESSVSTTEQTCTEATTTTTTTTTTETTSTEQTTTEPPQPLTTPPTIHPLLRLRTSLTYLLSTYIPASLRPTLHPLTLSNPLFAPLTTHLAAIAALKSEALALRSISDNISRKRAIEEDDDKVAEREEKKRKKEEEEKRKKSEGRGVKQLKKVDTSGMKKMSAFFKKVEKKA
ncbi:hypothetical protein CFE70_010113 [Pyrenophora teres f. teres 0-1]|uniref:Ribonuclease H2 subunit B n=1 Tax=Pyrenophora teres f. teres (strain 0-1) TaxID=861557 RepID=E3RSH6_PYRTT|nr:hypothetical protein PTT_11865 [Pyrenophora teres f. teres 0-1]KAE8832202.1 hypothetical protein PTNB85_06594 [Pyrenophora teres f. teres]KAE8855864.1 hypothetical protein PTNB29_08703 [Pyrenophora teres f. teres]KAE8860485.1 hypothetical protein PTNB73_08095 [Pyrenophora teres f. teres]KAK1911793.1 hypothetical protein P3342_013098 [Pyrenophora teres f. teres]